MNIDRNARRTTRQDYNDFINLLGINGQKQVKNDTGSANIPAKAPNKSLAMVYAQEQGWQGIFDPEIALINGTIFEELHKPFKMASCAGKANNFGEGCL
ncbi:MAG: spore coat associated protein CotJA [Clostridia bacterium]|nr:spore coat associated protein CotJA [Clostridia bacterium]